ncbi:subclass B1 metallo-beta-lactamase [Flavitalea sp.]|nr:subclass B1 metallo-beta-lactamase [Flavitalea sp.]
MKSATGNLRQIKIFLFTGLIFISCQESQTRNDKIEKMALQPDIIRVDSIVYQTENLIIQRLSNHIFEHQSFLTTNDFGKVECNGMIVVNGNEAIIFDTPADNKSSQELIDYANKVKWNIKAIIPTHFHEDCVGGLETFQQYGISGYASNQTISLLKSKGNKSTQMLKGFDDSLTMAVGNTKVYALYFGEGHTKDNIIGYYPEDKVIFGGCLIKETGATKGNLEDANVISWPATVRKLKQTYPDVQIVIPGHGKSGGTELFDYTIKLFE